MTVEQDKRTPVSVLTWNNSYWVVVVIALGIGVLVVVFSICLDLMLHDGARGIYASDWVEGFGAAILSGAALIQAQARRRELLIRMQIVEDVNHHVRNALTSIVLSASLREDSELDALVRDACDRIDWVLQDVLSQSVGATSLGAQHPSWSPGLQLEEKQAGARADGQDEEQ